MKQNKGNVCGGAAQGGELAHRVVRLKLESA